MLKNFYSSSVILWVDDLFEGVRLPEVDSWNKVFTSYPDNLFRIMDLSLQVASSYEEAMATILDYENSATAGTFLFGVLDLIIPPHKGAKPAIKYGIAVAKEMRRRGIQFVFLSANADASTILGQEGLGTVPYYIKETGFNPFQLPSSLIMKVLSEFKSNMSWVSLEDILETLHPDSDLVSDYLAEAENHNGLVPFKYFPFYGPFRNYVERCEYRDHFDIRNSFTIRSCREHCDSFVSQCLVIMLYQFLSRNPGKNKINFGHAHDQKVIQRLHRDESGENYQTIDIIRATPEKTSEDSLRALIHNAGLRKGITVFIIPNDESSDLYSEILREFHIMPIEELPQNQPEDLSDRLELVRRSSALVLEQWAASIDGENEFSLPKGYLGHSELLINPISWTIMTEAKNIVEELSDPYEILAEFMDSVNKMSKVQIKAFKKALKSARPIPYEHLLQVGDNTFKQSEFVSEFNLWIEKTLDNWLNSSWRFPYGLKSEFINIEGNGDFDIWKTTDWEAWEDNCYEILVKMMGEYAKSLSDGVETTHRENDLNRVSRFITALNGINFLSCNTQHIDWDSLELLRWPHLRYPLPSAITRRVGQAGRYLWIQPEGLDLSTALPVGRQRYRQLIDIVDHYWSVLQWSRQISKFLPRGWRESVDYLVNIIFEHRIYDAWENEPDRLWDALLCLLRNGGPIMLITDQILRQKPLSGNKDCAKEYLESVHGYGKILERLRGTRHHKIGTFFVPDWDAELFQHDVLRIREISQLLGLFENALKKDGQEKVLKLASATSQIINRLAKATSSNGNEDFKELPLKLCLMLSELFNDDKLSLNKNKGWFIKDLVPNIPDSLIEGQLPSLLGTKIDYLWECMDAILHLERITRRLRYFDGYHFLAAINDLRITSKDTRPMVGLPTIEAILELFVSSLEGILAQLAFCVELSGKKHLSEKIKPARVSIKTGDKFNPPLPGKLLDLIQVDEKEDAWEVFTLGIPGEGTSEKKCYHGVHEVCKLTRN